jgi:hypothetical protein
LANTTKHCGIDMTDKPDLEIEHTYNTNEPERVVTRATQLAMELSKEKKRLTEELATLQEEYDHMAPTTPIGTLDWYIKWVGVMFGVSGIFTMAAGLTMFGMMLYLCSAISWTLVGILWNDRAVMLGSVIPATATALSLVQKLII